MKNLVKKIYVHAVYNPRVSRILTSLAFVAVISLMYANPVYAGGGSGADPFSKIMDLVCGILQKIGGVVAFVGAFMIIWGFKDHNPDTKMNGITTAAVGGGLFTLSTVGKTFLN